MPSTSESARLGAREAARRIREGRLSPIALVEACLARIKALDGALPSLVPPGRGRRPETGPRTGRRGAGRAHRPAPCMVSRSASRTSSTWPPCRPRGSPVRGPTSRAATRPSWQRRAGGRHHPGQDGHVRFAFTTPRPRATRGTPRTRREAPRRARRAAVAARMVPLALGSQTWARARVPPPTAASSATRARMARSRPDGVARSRGHSTTSGSSGAPSPTPARLRHPDRRRARTPASGAAPRGGARAARARGARGRSAGAGSRRASPAPAPASWR